MCAKSSDENSAVMFKIISVELLRFSRHSFLVGCERKCKDLPRRGHYHGNTALPRPEKG